MREQELLDLVSHGENSGVEFKRDDLRPEQLAREIVALANLRGGRILLGVEDDGSISGLTRPDTEHWVMDVVFGRHVHPMILPFYEEVRVGKAQRVAVISIEAGVSKPYVVRHHGREDAYVRVGSTSRLATREQQARLFALGAMLHPEALAVSGTSLRDLSHDRLVDYIRDYVGDAALPENDEGWQERLCGLGLMTSPPAAPATSIAGLVLFGHSPRRALPQAGIRWMAFAGPTKEYRALDDTFVDGPMVALTRSGAGAGRVRVDPGLLERVIDRMRPFISTEAATVDEGLRRERSWHYPLEAVREVLLNALVHRDWTRALEVEVVAYSDRLEVVSPGALPNDMTIAKMLAGQRSPRNTLIVGTMRDYGYVDARGMGVRGKVVPLVQHSAGQAPRFAAADDQFCVTLPIAAGLAR